MTSEVPLYGKTAAGRVALVDDEDFELVSSFRWNVREEWRQNAHSVTHYGPYAVTGSKNLWMHRIITGWPRVDHINHNGLDNQRENLRPASALQNARNARPRVGAKSHFKGVSTKPPQKGGERWAARIRVQGVSKYLGYFSSEIEAARAYDAAALKFFGEFAYLNFPEDIPVPGEVRYEF